MATSGSVSTGILEISESDRADLSTEACDPFDVLHQAVEQIAATQSPVGEQPPSAPPISTHPIAITTTPIAAAPSMRILMWRLAHHAKVLGIPSGLLAQAKLWPSQDNHAATLPASRRFSSRQHLVTLAEKILGHLSPFQKRLLDPEGAYFPFGDEPVRRPLPLYRLSRGLTRLRNYYAALKESVQSSLSPNSNIIPFAPYYAARRTRYWGQLKIA